jgi:choice-of-anchor A domain-containing protein
MKFLSSSLFILFLSLSSLLQGTAPQPYQFNVYAVGNIGLNATNTYNGTFTGLVGAGDNVWGSGLYINTTGSAQTYSLLSGGNVTLSNSQVYNGGIQAGGNLTLTSTPVAGSVSTGGNLAGSSGTISGNATYAGSNTSTLTVTGTTTHQTYTPSITFPATSQYFGNAARFWSGEAATATWTTSSNKLTISALSSGRNIVDITLSQLTSDSSNGIVLTGSSTAYVIFNVTNSTSSGTLYALNNYTLSGGITANNILFNIGSNVSTLYLEGGTANILAPWTSLIVQASMTGNLVGANISGGGTVGANGTFSGYVSDQIAFGLSAPEPPSYVLMGSLLASVFYIKRRDNRK